MVVATPPLMYFAFCYIFRLAQGSGRASNNKTTLVDGLYLFQQCVFLSTVIFKLLCNQAMPLRGKHISSLSTQQVPTYPTLCFLSTWVFLSSMGSDGVQREKHIASLSKKQLQSIWQCISLPCAFSNLFWVPTKPWRKKHILIFSGLLPQLFY